MCAIRSKTFGTAINCIDGRTQLPLAHWFKETHRIDYVDTITEPGIDKLFTDSTKVNLIKSKVLVSINAHGSKSIVVSAHHDCAGNPVSKNEHIEQIHNAVSVINSWNLPAKVSGVWINEDWDVETVT